MRVLNIKNYSKSKELIRKGLNNREIADKLNITIQQANAYRIREENEYFTNENNLKEIHDSLKVKRDKDSEKFKERLTVLKTIINDISTYNNVYESKSRSLELKNAKLQDLLHSVENEELTARESVEKIKTLKILRNERRDLKNHLLYLETIKELFTLNENTSKSVKTIERVSRCLVDREYNEKASSLKQSDMEKLRKLIK